MSKQMLAEQQKHGGQHQQRQTPSSDKSCNWNRKNGQDFVQRGAVVLSLFKCFACQVYVDSASNAYAGAGHNVRQQQCCRYLPDSGNKTKTKQLLRLLL
jgi:hypothetical protein